MGNNKILVFSKTKEIGISFQKYFKYVLNLPVDLGVNPADCLLLILDLTDKENQTAFIKYLLNNKKNAQIPLTLILNPEKSLNDYFEYTRDLRDYTFKLFAFTEIFYDYYIPISLPFEMKGIKRFLLKKYPNPFAEFPDIIEKTRCFFKNNFPTDGIAIVEEAGKWIYEGTRKEKESGATHGKEDRSPEEIKPEMWFYRLLLSHLFQKRMKKPFKILWIENNPNRELKKIDSRLEGQINEESLGKVVAKFCQIFTNFEVDIIKKGFTEAYQNLCKFREGEGNRKFASGYNISDILNNPEKSSPKEITFKELDEYSLILVDIFLEEDKKEKVDGIRFIQTFTKFFPHIPAFVLSVSDDCEIISEAIKEGADFYILKSDVLSLPFAYYLYMRKLGKVIEFIKNEELRKSLIGNIRYWNFKRNLLWFGDKCYHMIEHSFQHTKEDWEIANEILYLILKERRMEILDETLYSFLMAIWLHDIGHKGNKKYGEAYQIRDNHGYLAGELIVQHPSLLRIFDNENYYESLDFTHPEFGSLVEVILDRVKSKETKKLSTTEKIALFALYHKSNCPITISEYNSLISENRFIPVEYYRKGERHKDNVITLETIVNNPNLEEEQDKNYIIPLAFLLRFIDALDVRVSRVGDSTEEKLKKIVIKNDALYSYEKLKKEVKAICPDKSQELLWVKILGEDVVKSIKENNIVSFDELEQCLTAPENFENYMMLVNHASFVTSQPGHFDLHSSVERMDVDFRDKLNIKIYLNETFETLEQKEINERGRKSQTLYQRIVGDESEKISSYFYSEMKTGWRYIKEILREVPKITIIDVSGESKEALFYQD